MPMGLARPETTQSGKALRGTAPAALAELPLKMADPCSENACGRSGPASSSGTEASDRAGDLLQDVVVRLVGDQGVAQPAQRRPGREPRRRRPRSVVRRPWLRPASMRATSSGG